MLGFENVALGQINGVAPLTEFPYKIVYVHFVRPNKRGRYNEVTILTKWP